MSDPSDETRAGLVGTDLPEDEEEEEVEEEGEEAEEPKATADELVAKALVETPPAPPRVRKIDFVSRRNWYFLLSLLIIIPGIYFMVARGFALGIDFAGGTEFTVQFPASVTQAQVESAVAAQNIDGSVISTGSGGYIIRSVALPPNQQKIVEDNLRSRLGDYTLVQVLEVGGTIAKETIELALLSVVLAAIAILVLLTFRFRNVPGGWRAGFQFGGSALAALLHDVFLLTGVFAILGKGFDLKIGEINSLFVTAVLTVVGFSVHDTIVVFDRIRENLRVSQRLSFEQVVNLSIMQTAARSIITSFTVVLVLVAILVSGGDTLKGFALALLIGIVSGTYSSIFNAAPLLVVWRRLQPLR
ncbi:MAG: protein translocase subunit SecF [Chloroflexi bacterium]|nr:MAG: protein translocase subunit SecF [Chloroflexota bacterium]TME58792.1 MAG: protein translocase subunit SecF [Chloroflexota bacterium]